MFIIETFARGYQPKHRPAPASGARAGKEMHQRLNAPEVQRDGP
jgi:hypothetical protein